MKRIEAPNIRAEHDTGICPSNPNGVGKPPIAGRNTEFLRSSGLRDQLTGSDTYLQRDSVVEILVCWNACGA